MGDDDQSDIGRLRTVFGSVHSGLQDRGSPAVRQ